MTTKTSKMRDKFDFFPYFFSGKSPKKKKNPSVVRLFIVMIYSSPCGCSITLTERVQISSPSSFTNSTCTITLSTVNDDETIVLDFLTFGVMLLSQYCFHVQAFVLLPPRQIKSTVRLYRRIKNRRRQIQTFDLHNN